MYIPIGAAKIVLFLHIRKKKVQFVEKPALFYLEVGPLRNVYLHAVGIKRALAHYTAKGY